MRIVLRLLLAVLCTAVLLVVSSPLWLYALGLSLIEGRPERPAAMASAEDQARAWQLAGGHGAPVIESTNPYQLVLDLWRETDTRPEERVAMWVSGDYVIDHRKGKNGMLGWHLSSAALSIWLARNWSTEELLTAASRSPRVQRGWNTRRVEPASGRATTDPLMIELQSGDVLWIDAAGWSSVKERRLP
ncbi:hypothetical protein ACQ859_19870 [Roseateles chitinivorans]|uniref:hypothetical protein n=1 Tax=Roseateles chitinivorans TaxID=2917965 RepID=UPI003D66C43A